MPKRKKALVVLGIIYLFLPVDLIPPVLFPIGFLDDIVPVSYTHLNDKVDVKVTFPEEYHAEDLAGKDAVFHCTVHEVKEEQLPEIDDEFVKDVSEYDTLEELKNATRERLEKYAKASAENQMQDAALIKVVEANDVEVPAVMVEDEIDRMAQELDQQLRYQGLNLNQYMEFTGKDMAEFREELKPDAERQVKTRMLLNGIAEAEKLEISEDELEEELKSMAEMGIRDRYEDQATMVTGLDADGLELYCVVMGSTIEGRYTDIKTLMDYGKANVSKYTAFEQGDSFGKVKLTGSCV